MRIIHTSDWHLGRRFGPVSLANDQAAFLEWLVGQCEEQQADLLVVAGDIFDRAVAPTEAIVLFRETLRRVRALRGGAVRVAVIAGNHDGADRVAAYDQLLDQSGVFVRGGYANVGEVLPLDFADGPLSLVLLPFLDPQAAPDALSGTGEAGEAERPDDARDPADAAHAALMRRTHQSVLAAAIDAAQPRLVGASRSLAVAHAFVAGALTSDSERQLTVGGTGTVDVACFAGFSYTALGHLHRPQAVAGNEHIRYSGTPLAYSFSEGHDKSIAVVDLAPDGNARVETIAVPVGRSVRTFTGTIEDLLTRQLEPGDAGSFVRAVLTDRGVVHDAKQRLAAVYPHVVEIQLVPAASGGIGPAPVGIDLRVPPGVVVERFWTDSTGRAPDPAELDLLHRAIDAAERGAA